MKQEIKTTQPDSKKGLHTKWENIGGDSQSRYIHAYNENGDNGLVAIAKGNNPDEVKANAELIVKAVNEYEILKEARNQLCQLVKDMTDEKKALLDSHRELLDIVKRLDYWHHLEDGVFSYTDPKVDGDELTIQLQNAINNAKNI